jgi:hypothetical protein
MPLLSITIKKKQMDISDEDIAGKKKRLVAK